MAINERHEAIENFKKTEAVKTPEISNCEIRRRGLLRELDSLQHQVETKRALNILTDKEREAYDSEIDELKSTIESLERDLNNAKKAIKKANKLLTEAINS